MTEILHLRYSSQGNGTVEAIGNHSYRVCGPAGCTVVMGVSNALYLSHNVPEVEREITHLISHRSYPENVEDARFDDQLCQIDAQATALRVDQHTVTLEPKQQQEVTLCFCPLKVGELRVVGVRWCLYGEVWGRHRFERQGPLLHATRAQRASRARAEDAGGCVLGRRHYIYTTSRRAKAYGLSRSCRYRNAAASDCGRSTKSTWPQSAAARSARA